MNVAPQRRPTLNFSRFHPKLFFTSSTLYQDSAATHFTKIPILTYHKLCNPSTVYQKIERLRLQPHGVMYNFYNATYTLCGHTLIEQTQQFGRHVQSAMVGRARRLDDKESGMKEEQV